MDLQIHEMSKKEAEMVEGTWFRYFKKVVDPVFTDETCKQYEDLLTQMYGDFFERNLSPKRGPLLSLGAGFGLTEIPLARGGFDVIGIDNDLEVLELLKRNSQAYGEGRIVGEYGNLYSNFHKAYVGGGIQACISFGVLEHFTREDLDDLIRKQFEISPLLLAMIPINTPESLRAFGAVSHPVGHVDQNGIYRNFWSANHWENDVFGRYDFIDRHLSTNHAKIGQVDMATYLVREA